MTSRSPLDRQTPRGQLELFWRWVNKTDRNASHVAAQAVLEYLPPRHVPDGYRTAGHELETQLRDDLRALNLVGHCSPNNSAESDDREKSNIQNEPTVLCRVRFDDALIEALEKYVTEVEEKQRGTVGVHFARALSEYREGGQLGRLREFYQRLRDHAELLPEDRDTRIDDVVSAVEEITAQREPKYINGPAIRDIITRETGVESDDAIRQYQRDVLDRLGWEEATGGVYAAPESHEDVITDQVAVDLDSGIDAHRYEQMSREDKVRHLQTALRQRSEADGGAPVAFDYKDVVRRVFDSHPSASHAYTLMEQAAENDAFRYGEHNGTKRVRFNPAWENDDAREVPPPESDGWVAEAAKAVPDAVGDDPPEAVLDNKIVRAKWPDRVDDVEGPAEAALNDVTNQDRQRVRDHLRDEEGGRSQPAEETTVDERLDTLAGARVAADGGEPSA